MKTVHGHPLEQNPKNRLATGEINEPALNPQLAWLTLILGYGFFFAVMNLQAQFNLWLLSLLTVGALLPMSFFSYGPKLDSLLAVSSSRILYGLAGAVILSGFSYVLFPPLVEMWPSLRPAMEQCYQNLQAWPGKYWALPVILGLVLVEELIWRGLLFDLLAVRLKGWRLVLVCTILFPIPHVLTGNAALSLTAFALGALCTYLRYRYENLISPLIAHFGWNLIIMVFFPLNLIF